MGRGRQKAKATKVARKLKYFSPETDYAALERELVSTSSGPETDDEVDYEQLAAKYAVDDARAGETGALARVVALAGGALAAGVLLRRLLRH